MIGQATIPGTHNLEKLIPKFKKENGDRIKGIVPVELIDAEIAKHEARQAEIEAAKKAALPDAAAASPDDAAAAPNAAAAGAKDEL